MNSVEEGVPKISRRTSSKNGPLFFFLECRQAARRPFVKSPALLSPWRWGVGFSKFLFPAVGFVSSNFARAHAFLQLPLLARQHPPDSFPIGLEFGSTRPCVASYRIPSAASSILRVLVVRLALNDLCHFPWIHNFALWVSTSFGFRMSFPLDSQ